MILSELILYLFLGSLVLATSLKLFQISWLSFKAQRRMHDVATDFMHVSERLKFDLLGDLERITVQDDRFAFYFLQLNTQTKSYELKEYTVMMQGSRLVYNIHHGTGYTANYLSSLVKSIRPKVQGDLMAIDFDYGDQQFRRYYRIDHIPEKWILHSRHDPSDALSGDPFRRARAGSGGQSVEQLHLVS